MTEQKWTVVVDGSKNNNFDFNDMEYIFNVFVLCFGQNQHPNLS